MSRITASSIIEEYGCNAPIVCKAVAATIRRLLRERSGMAWSVTLGRGTSYGWIHITAPRNRRSDYDGMSQEDSATLARLLGHSRPMGPDSVAASYDYYAEYLDRAAGREPRVKGEFYWD